MITFQLVVFTIIEAGNSIQAIKDLTTFLILNILELTKSTKYQEQQLLLALFGRTLMNTQPIHSKCILTEQSPMLGTVGIQVKAILSKSNLELYFGSLVYTIRSIIMEEW